MSVLISVAGCILLRCFFCPGVVDMGESSRLQHEVPAGGLVCTQAARREMSSNQLMPHRFHRACAFLQLVVFSAMAAFTNNFDVSGGLFGKQDADEAEQLQLNLNQMALSVLQAQRWRSRRLPILNARGISMVAFFSRLLMFTQYLLGVYPFELWAE